jgi:hypothetical protein
MSKSSSAARQSKQGPKRDASTQVPVCKYCKNFNNPNIPFDHWLRESPDPKSPITCPMLNFNTECSWCDELGHTKKYCKDRIDYLRFKYSKQQDEAENKNVKKEETKPAQPTTNPFAVLLDDEEEEDKHLSKMTREQRMQKHERDLVEKFGVIVCFPTQTSSTREPAKRPQSPLSPPPTQILLQTPSSSFVISKDEFPALSSKLKTESVTPSIFWRTFKR